MSSSTLEIGRSVLTLVILDLGRSEATAECRGSIPERLPGELVSAEHRLRICSARDMRLSPPFSQNRCALLRDMLLSWRMSFRQNRYTLLRDMLFSWRMSLPQNRCALLRDMLFSLRMSLPQNRCALLRDML
ncbi:hypothetical protein [Mesorhizobium sp. 1M-11]|uniref:hypothetical protein n=1 Tax=Mesorhizobium sp. 1M-11 TaxID=1529006 RepID=UPI00128F3730|nr:hypothetical protein [Mesorhizobium sp. 1M-11]